MSDAAPNPLQGTREPLLLLATGCFLSAFWGPITGVLGSAGMALGMHDLRKSEAGARLGRLRRWTAIAAWCAGASWVAILFRAQLGLLPLILQPLSILGAALALRRLALADGANGLARAFLALGWIPSALLPLLYLGLPQLGVVVYTISVLALAVLALRIRTRALPYGRLVPRRARA